MQVVGEEVMVLPKTEIKEEDVVPQVGNKINKITGLYTNISALGEVLQKKGKDIV